MSLCSRPRRTSFGRSSLMSCMATLATRLARRCRSCISVGRLATSNASVAAIAASSTSDSAQRLRFRAVGCCATVRVMTQFRRPVRQDSSGSSTHSTSGSGGAGSAATGAGGSSTATPRDACAGSAFVGRLLFARVQVPRQRNLKARKVPQPGPKPRFARANSAGKALLGRLDAQAATRSA